MTDLKLYRRRFIPDEKVFLKNDKLILCNDDVIVTKWNVIKKRNDFTHGASCYFLKHNFKVSKFVDNDENILYWYCDIIDWNFDKLDNSYTFNDLLIDIIVYKNGFVKVVDMSEIVEALDMKIIDIELAKKAIRTTDNLLNIIYSGNFSKLQSYIINI